MPGLLIVSPSAKLNLCQLFEKEPVLLCCHTNSVGQVFLCQLCNKDCFAVITKPAQIKDEKG